MSKATFTPAAEAITETKTVEVSPAIPATVTLTLTPREATVVMGLLGRTVGHAGWGPYSALANLADGGHIQQPNDDHIVQRRGSGLSPNTDLI